MMNRYLAIATRAVAVWLAMFAFFGIIAFSWLRVTHNEAYQFLHQKGTPGDMRQISNELLRDYTVATRFAFGSAFLASLVLSHTVLLLASRQAETA